MSRISANLWLLIVKIPVNPFECLVDTMPHAVAKKFPQSSSHHTTRLQTPRIQAVALLLGNYPQLIMVAEHRFQITTEAEP